MTKYHTPTAYLCKFVKALYTVRNFPVKKNSKELAAWLPASNCKINGVLLLVKITVGYCLLKNSKEGCQQVAVKLTMS